MKGLKTEEKSEAEAASSIYDDAKEGAEQKTDCELLSLGGLVCNLLEGILAKVVRSQFKGELEILNRKTFIQAMEAVVNFLCKREGKVSTALEYLDVLVQVGHSLGQR